MKVIDRKSSKVLAEYPRAFIGCWFLFVCLFVLDVKYAAFSKVAWRINEMNLIE